MSTAQKHAASNYKERKVSLVSVVSLSIHLNSAFTLDQLIPCQRLNGEGNGANASIELER